MKKVLLIFILGLFLFNAGAQELNCNVQVTSQQVQGSDRKIYETLRDAIYEFMNNQSWTNYNIKNVERIDCSILFNVTDRPQQDYFRTEMTIALRRPVLNSSYNSVLFNYIDKDVEFEYIENQPLDYSTGIFTSNLTSVLAYYTYIMLGLDFDSFVQEGGGPYYEAALNIVNTAQSSGYKGWSSSEGTKNRYWLLENITNPSYSGIRSFYYDYHRLGLDIMYEEPEKGREAMLNSLSDLQQVKQSRPSLIILQIISDSKRDEFVNVFSEGVATEKSSAVKLLNEIDPSNAMTYQKILQK
jgi:hypothetical protein